MKHGDPRTYAIIGAAMAVHTQLGCGYLEAVYQESLAIEMESREIPFACEVELPVWYRGQRLDATYRVDFVCFDSVIVEVKALSALTGGSESQVINYMKASKSTVGLLLNFGARSLQYERYALTHSG